MIQDYYLVQIPIFLPGPNGLNNPEYLFVRNEYLNLTGKYQKQIPEEFIGGMPVTLENECFKPLIRTNADNRFVYNLTLKVDGERYLLFLTSNGYIYLIDRSLIFFTFMTQGGERLPRIDGVLPFLIDGELISHSAKEFEFLIFDLLFYQNESYIEKNYYVRYDVAKYAIENVLLLLPLMITLKQWFPITDIIKTDNIYSYITNKTNGTRDKKHHLKADGLVLQPFDTEYITFGPWIKPNNVQFKWKPANDQTMDFKIKIANKNRWELLTKSGYPFTMPGSGQVAICEPNEANRRDFADGDVAEFIYSKITKTFKIVRGRPNKQANSMGAILSILNFIEHPFTLDDMKPLIKNIVEGTHIDKILKGLSKSQLILCILNKYLFFTNKEVENIKKFFDIYMKADNLEMECRIIKKGKKGSSVDKFTFLYFLDYLLLLNNTPVSQSNTIDVSAIKKEVWEPTRRSSYSSVDNIINKNSISNETKKQLNVYFSEEPKKKQSLYNNLQFKLVLSEELKTNNIIGLKTLNPANRVGSNNSIRIKNRYSFEFYSLWRLDLTIVKSGYSINEASESNEVYEIECEYIGPKDISFNKFIKSLSNVYIMILTNTSYC